MPKKNVLILFDLLEIQILLKKIVLYLFLPCFVSGFLFHNFFWVATSENTLSWYFMYLRANDISWIMRIGALFNRIEVINKVEGINLSMSFWVDMCFANCLGVSHDFTNKHDMQTNQHWLFLSFMLHWERSRSCSWSPQGEAQSCSKETWSCSRFQASGNSDRVTMGNL